MKIVYLLVFWCGVASSTEFTPDYHKALALNGYVEYPYLGMCAYNALNTWIGIMPLKAFFEDNKLVIDNENVVPFMSTFAALKKIFDYVSHSGIRITLAKYESIATKCKQLRKLQDAIDGSWDEWFNRSIDRVATAQKILTAKIELPDIGESIIKELLKYVVEACDDRSNYGKLADDLEKIFDSNLDDPETTLDPTEFEYELPVEDAAHLIYMTLNSVLPMRNALAVEAFDDKRSKIELTTHFYFFRMAVGIIDSNKRMNREDYNDIAFKCDELKELYEEFEAAYGPMPEDTDIQIAADVDQILEAIVIRTNDILYEFLYSCPELGVSIDGLRKVLSDDRRVWLQMHDVSSVNKASFIMLVDPIAGYIFRIAHAVLDTKRAYTEVKVLMMTGYQYVLAAVQLIAAYFNEPTIDDAWQLPSDEVQSQIQTQFDLLDEHIKGLAAGVNAYQDKAKRADSLYLTQVELVDYFEALRFQKIAPIFYKLIRIFLPLLPPCEQLKFQYNEHVAHINELIKHRELIGVSPIETNELV